MRLRRESPRGSPSESQRGRDSDPRRLAGCAANEPDATSKIPSKGLNDVDLSGYCESAPLTRVAPEGRFKSLGQEVVSGRGDAIVAAGLGAGGVSRPFSPPSAAIVSGFRDVHAAKGSNRA